MAPADQKVAMPLEVIDYRVAQSVNTGVVERGLILALEL